MSGAAVTPAGGGRGNPAGRASAAKGGGGGPRPGTGGCGGAEGCCGPGPGPEQDPLSAAGHRGATVSGLALVLKGERGILQMIKHLTAVTLPVALC